MQIHEEPVLKEVKPINFLFFRTETNMGGLSNLIPVAKALFREAVNNDLHITGPVQWHYFGFTGIEDQSFTLEIALPVDRVVEGYDGIFHFKRTENFRSASIVHEGSWSDMGMSYERLMKFMEQKKLQPSAVSREVYLNADFVHPEANMTEIQIGIN